MDFNREEKKKKDKFMWQEYSFLSRNGTGEQALFSDGDIKFYFCTSEPQCVNFKSTPNVKACDLSVLSLTVK